MVEEILYMARNFRRYLFLHKLGWDVIMLHLEQIDKAFAHRLYENMQLLPTLDTVLYNVQRQGKISFYVCHISVYLFPFSYILQMTAVSEA